MMASTLGFCIVGCGMIARFHVRGCWKCPELRSRLLLLGLLPMRKS